MLEENRKLKEKIEASKGNVVEKEKHQVLSQRFVEELINDGKYKEAQVVPSDWIKKMITLQVETPILYKLERVLPKIGGGYYTFISRDGTNIFKFKLKEVC